MRVIAVEDADDILIIKSTDKTKEFADKIRKALENGECEIDTVKKKRSLNANAYMWVLCSEIGKKMNKSKDDIYLKAIRDVGSFEYLPVKEEAVEDFIRHWNGRGLGWVVEKVGESKLRGYMNVIAYFGSSSYDTKEMSKLIDYLIADAEELGIQTMQQEELNSLIKEWGKGEIQKQTVADV